MSKVGRGLELLQFKLSQRLGGVSVSNTPWFDDETLAWFTERLPKAQSYMEFGSGGSTMMAAQLGIPTISVEGDHFFATSVEKQLSPGHKVEMLKPPIGMTGLWGVPVPGSPTPARLQKWRSYIDLPFAKLATSNHPFPDLFLVDGRFRRACALRAALETQRADTKAQLLFDDYASEGRETYRRIEDNLGKPHLIGRSAIFDLEPDNHVTESHVEEAMADFR